MKPIKLEDFDETRPDGWPLCPQCGKDELSSLLPRSFEDYRRLEALPKDKRLRERVESGLRCYACGWSNELVVAVAKKRAAPWLEEPDTRDISHFFGLTYSSYLVLHRSLLEAMPAEWQVRFVQMLDDLEKVFDTDKVPSDFWVRAREGGRFVQDPYRDYRRPPPLPYREEEPK